MSDRGEVQRSIRVIRAAIGTLDRWLEQRADTIAAAIVSPRTVTEITRTVAGRSDELVVGAVDDPSGAMRLVGARGAVTSRNVERLWRELDELRAGYGAHVDLTRATIPDAVAMARIEQMLDLLEGRGVAVRLVGVDPDHPALRTSARR